MSYIRLGRLIIRKLSVCTDEHCLLGLCIHDLEFLIILGCHDHRLRIVRLVTDLIYLYLDRLRCTDDLLCFRAVRYKQGNIVEVNLMCICDLCLSFLGSHIDNKPRSRVGIFFHRELLGNRLCLRSDCDEIACICMVVSTIDLYTPLDHALNIRAHVKAHGVNAPLRHRKSIIVNLAAMLKRSALRNIADQFTICCRHCEITIVRVACEPICRIIIEIHTDRICAFYRSETIILHNFLFGRCPVAIILDG